MALDERKESTITAEASSGPVSSENQTLKSLKAKPKIAKKPADDSVTSTSKVADTPVQGRKKVLKKKIVVGSKIINSNKEDVQNANGGDMKQKNVLSGEQSKINHGNLKKEVPGIKKGNNSDDTVDSQNLNGEKLKQEEVIGGEQSKNSGGNLKRKKKVIVVRKKINKSNETEGSQALNMEESKNVTNAEQTNKGPENVKDEVQGHGKNGGNFDGSKNKWLCQNIEDRNGLSNKEEHQKNKEKLSGPVGNEQKIKKEGKKCKIEGEWKERRNKIVGGLILFCNAKTKSDCFRYHIMGVSSGRKELVLDIKPGLTLFLYDFDIKLLYGIYSASSAGGAKLEPAAFNGSFPFQVRFEVHRDCYPLPESVFKRAIKENYDGKNKFDQELTFQQVNRLMELFKPAEVKQLALPVYPPPPLCIDREEAKEGKADYLAHHRRESARGSEAEYLARHRMEPLAGEPYTYNESRRYDLQLNKNDEHLMYRREPSAPRETSSEQLFLSEKDYRAYGLRRERRNVTPPRSHVAPTLELDSRAQEHLLVCSGREAEKDYPTSYGHFPRQELHSSAPHMSASTASIVDSYLKVPYYSSSDDPYQLPPRPEREEVALGSYSLGRGEATYQPDSRYLLRREIYRTPTKDYMMEASSYRTMRERDDAGALYSSYASKALSEYNQLRTSEGARPETSLAPVSARYSFAGPSQQYL